MAVWGKRIKNNNSYTEEENQFDEIEIDKIRELVDDINGLYYVADIDARSLINIDNVSINIGNGMRVIKESDVIFTNSGKPLRAGAVINVNPPSYNFGIPTEDNSDFTITTRDIESHPTTLTYDGDSMKFSQLDGTAKISDDYLAEQLKEIWNRLNKTVSLVHNCANCGARLEVEENKPIIHCKYCGSTYLVGAVQPNSA